MDRPMRWPTILLAAGLAIGGLTSLQAPAAEAPAAETPAAETPAAETPADEAPKVALYRLGPVEDVDGKTVTAPEKDRAALLLFLMTDQPQSQKAMTQVLATLGKEPPVQVVTVLSGKQVDAAAKTLKEKLPGTVVIDQEYTIADQMGVLAWPTTVLLAPTGEKVGHLAGLSKSFARDLQIHLDFATGKIDRPALTRRLATKQVIADDPAQMAHRHLEVANRQLAKGLVQQARLELERGVQLAPTDPTLQLAMARMHLLLGQADQALALLEKVKPPAVPPWQIDTLRGRALVALKQWDQAAVVLKRATTLNPEPAEAYYALGRLHEHKGEWQEAANAYRAAMGSTPAGRLIEPPEPAAVKPAVPPVKKEPAS